MNEEIRKAIDEVLAAVAAMRAANDLALKQKADKGHVDAELQGKVDKLNADITAKMAEVAGRMDTFERRMNRAELEPAGPSALKDECHAFGLVMAARRPERAHKGVSLEEFKAYREAFRHWLRTGQEERAAMEVGSDPAGGYVVLPNIGGNIVKLVYESSPMRQLCGQRTITSDAFEDYLDLNQAGASWVGEKRTVSATTTPDLGKYRVEAKELQAMPPATQKLLDDASIDIEAWLAEKVADVFSRTENESFINGNTPVEPLGIIGGRTPSSAAVTASAWNHVRYYPSGAAGAFHASIPGDYLIDQVFGLKNAYRQNAKWLMARTTLAAARKLKDGDGNYLWTPDFSQYRSGLLLGYPIVEGEDMPVIASNSYSIAFGDFKKAYLIVDRMGIRVLRDPYTDKPNVRFYTTKRVGGDVVNFEAINLMKFAAS